ncbi:hypothetical protein [Nitratireductor indicus]|uniref:hypothetical protein n=1 Tax=Nitratireductor indicus TaxID=721133 RepID=UPI0028769D02|nr:hypothetical protein [Nitratireductor indicus]MDS1138595.1 hypothetical protein [Nitratireductor indicus]
MNLSYSQLSDIFKGMELSKREWLRTHGVKRGEMDRQQREIECAACERAAMDYARAAERDRKAEAMDG